MNDNAWRLAVARTDLDQAERRLNAAGRLDRESEQQLLAAFHNLLAYIETHPVLTVSDKIDESGG